MSSSSVNDNKQEMRFELPLEEGQVAYISYNESEDGVVDLLHTEVPLGHEGKGAGTELVKGTLELIQESNRKIVPSCAFVDVYVKRHPEYHSMLLNTDETTGS